MKRSGSMWIRDDDTFMGAVFDATGDRFEIEHLEEALRYGGGRRLALDVGAHYGSWSRYLSGVFERVMSFEPVTDTFACLQLNVEHLANVEIHNTAVGEEAGFVTVGVGKMYTHPGMETVTGSGPCKIVRIDDLGLDQLDFLKVDVEGYELFVLKGAERTLKACKPVVILEENIRGPLEHGIANGECARYLESIGACFVKTMNKDLIFTWPPLVTPASFSAQFAGCVFRAVDDEVDLPIVASIGRDHETGEAECNIVGGSLPERPRHPYRVVSFYTSDNGYDIHAARLRESLTRLSIPFVIEEMSNEASWEAICARKAQFVLRQWQASDTPVVWIDADAVVERVPALFASIDADFGAHRWTWEAGREDFGYEFASGTLYFGKTALAGKLLERWVLRCQADPDTWDQRHIESAWCDIATLHPLRTVWLPRSYLQIEGGLEISPAVVRHFQASRQEKAARPRAPRPQFELTPAGVDDRRRGRLWRTQEQAFWLAEGVKHIIPDVGTAFPEGFDVQEVLLRFLGVDATILEFGCGTGRIAGLFEPARYLGIDINPHAIAVARARNPGHQTRIWDAGRTLPPTTAVLFYTVLLHVADAALVPLLTELSAGRDCVLIAELMDSRWRRDGNPPVFNRDPEHYILAMSRLGFVLDHFEKHAYARYDAQPFNIGRDSRITFLKFLRR